MANGQKREIAFKVRIAEVQDGEYVKEEGDWTPNYVLIGTLKVSRVNIMGIVVLKEQEGDMLRIWLDDGTDKISLRTFENRAMLEKMEIGDATNVIGRPNQFGAEKYIVAESVKKVSPVWMKVRQLELKPREVPQKETPAPEREMKKGGVSAAEQIFRMIKELDLGGGADMERIVSGIQGQKAEEVIRRLLEEGEIFEVRPGRLKILE